MSLKILMTSSLFVDSWPPNTTALTLLCVETCRWLDSRHTFKWKSTIGSHQVSKISNPCWYCCGALETKVQKYCKLLGVGVVRRRLLVWVINWSLFLSCWMMPTLAQLCLQSRILDSYYIIRIDRFTNTDGDRLSWFETILR